MSKKSRSVFYSWQSDTPNALNRSLIEHALQDALTALNERLVEVEVAERPTDLKLDRDTKGVPGNPPLFDTILKKIDACSAYVADLTFVAKSSPKTGKKKDIRFVPNPNVLIEYGYALKSHGHDPIINVMNTAYGDPTAEKLPFDLRHCRHPIQYFADENSDKAAVRKQLAKDLESALELILTSDDSPSEINARFTRASAAMSAWSEKAQDGELFNDLQLKGAEAPAIPREGLCYLSFHPTKAVAPLVTPLDALQHAKAGKLRAMDVDTHFQLMYSRNPEGAVAFQWAHQSVLIGFTQLYLSQELLGVDCHSMKTLGWRQGGLSLQAFDPVEVEASFAFTLEVYRRFAITELKQTAPWTFTAGLHGVKRFTLVGNGCLREGFEQTGTLDLKTPTHVALQPFFQRMWKEFGTERASNATEALLSHQVMELLARSK